MNVNAFDCIKNLDWLKRPCDNFYEPNGGFGGKDEWKQYYEMKGKEWMEAKKIEMNYAIQEGILREWVNYEVSPQNQPNFNVWYYYQLHGEVSRDIRIYDIERDNLKPIITYYYISPGAILLVGALPAATIIFGVLMGSKFWGNKSMRSKS